MKKITAILFIIGLTVLVLDILALIIYVVICQPAPKEEIPTIFSYPALIATLLIFVYFFYILIRERKPLTHYIKEFIKTGTF